MTKNRDKPKRPARGNTPPRNPNAELLNHLMGESERSDLRIVIKETDPNHHPRVLWAGTPKDFLQNFSIRL